MRVSSYDRRSAVFVVEEVIPIMGSHQAIYRVRLRQRMCDCGRFQQLHRLCRHVVAACAAIGCGLNGTGELCGPTRRCEGRPRGDQFPLGLGTKWTLLSVQRSAAIYVGNFVT
ncbi:hypothetical protein PIB30_069231 [Stylosanthes scabra]|uniref:SWIM-type domain-containing protein n=1 Tax=Stylosanthes scabra TaxID=79078 RepID=A0ABU6QQB0_9FABA|nr:hypothetical protein [Stylosanthes scabra]